VRSNARGPVFYLLLPSAFGTLGIVWIDTSGQAVIQRVFLSSPQATAQERLRNAYPAANGGSHPAVASLGAQLQAFMEGEPVVFTLNSVALETCPQFQQRVLVAEHGIPRGWVSTYGLIAAHIGVKRGARAVGSALARNPFPLIVPCHRAIRSDGSLGGYQGGLAMKRRLLELENVPVSETGKVVKLQLYYRLTP
jgi:methylated-DNA-[protein]-cysteine S-methyltransferase